MIARSRAPQEKAQTPTRGSGARQSLAEDQHPVPLRRAPAPVCIAAVLALSVIVVALFLAILPASARVNEQTDYIRVYVPVARNLLAGRGIVNADGSPATRYPPGYPLLVAGVLWAGGRLGISAEAAHAAFAMLGMGLASVCVFLIARSVWGTGLALISALCWMTYPLALWLTKQPNSEIPFMPVFYCGFYLCWDALRRRQGSGARCFLAGLLIGAAMLIRPIAIGSGLVLAALLGALGGWQPGRRSLIFLLLLGNFVAVAPWEAWLYRTTGKLTLLCTNGAGSVEDGLTFAVDERHYRQPVAVPNDVASLMRTVQAHYRGPESIGGVATVMREEIETHPLSVFRLLGLKVMRSWYGTDSHRFEQPIMLLQLPYLAAFLASSLVAWRRRGMARRLVLCSWVLVLYFWALTILSLTVVRYMVPVTGLLFALLPALFLPMRRGEGAMAGAALGAGSSQGG